VPPEGQSSGGVRHYDDWAQHEPVTVGAPAVATGFTHRVPGATVQRIRSVSFVLVADANAANRIARVEYLDAAGAVFAAVAAPFTVTANITSRLTFGIGIQQFGANAAAQIGGPLPDLLLQAGLAVRVAVAAIQAGDQISGASLFVDQYPIRD
jgi:hypothetical protein